MCPSRGSRDVVAAVLGHQHNVPLDSDVKTLGNLLLSGKNGTVVVYNPSGSTREDYVISIPVPICALTITDAQSGSVVTSQVVAALDIHDGAYPYYDFTLYFKATIPSRGSLRFNVDPTADGVCGGGDVSATSAVNDRVQHFVRHARVWPNTCVSRHAGKGTDRTGRDFSEQDLLLSALLCELFHGSNTKAFILKSSPP